MSQNKAFFTYTQNTTPDLSLTLKDRSVGEIASKVWTIDGGTNIALDTPDPSIKKVQYPQAGMFEVTLEVTFLTGEVLQYTSDVLVGFSFDILPLVEAMLPSAITQEKQDKIKKIIQKWQLYLYSAAMEYVPKSDVFIANSWPIGFNVLISKLVLWDLLMDQASGMFLSGSNGKGGTKKIQTGPAIVEWFDPAASWAAAFKGANGNLIELLLKDLCYYARRVGVGLPMCAGLKNTILFSIYHPRNAHRRRLC